MIDTRLWTVAEKPDMQFARRTHATMLYNNIVYVFAGWDGGAICTNEKYSLIKNSWERLPDLTNNSDATGCALFKDKIYISGNRSHDLYTFDPVTEFLMPVIKNFDAASHDACIAVANESLYIFRYKVIFKMEKEDEAH